MILRPLLIFALLFSLLSPLTMAQDRLLTLDDLYHPETQINFNGTRPIGLQWLSDSDHYLQRTDAPEGPYLKVHAVTGETTSLFDAEILKEKFRALPGFDEESARVVARESTMTLSPDESAFLISHSDDLFYYNFVDQELAQLTHSPEPELEPAFSPDGRLVAFVRNHDLYLTDVMGLWEKRLTQGGSKQIYNGLLDWVYQEELYGRGDFKGYWWSPDSRHIAYLQLDDSRVPEFTVVDHIPIHLDLEVSNYPKAGDQNPGVRLGLLDIRTARTEWIDLYAYSGIDFLIVNVGWSPGGDLLTFQIQDREQTWLDLNFLDLETGEVRSVFREKSEAWVNRRPNPLWLKNGDFLWQSEQDGWEHLYLYNDKGEPEARLTSGEWEVQRVEAVDQDNGYVYFVGTRDSHVERHVYRVEIQSGKVEKVSQRSGSHSPEFSSNGALYIDTWSDVRTPHQIRLHRASGEEIRVIEANPVEVLDEFKLGGVEFLTVDARDGFTMEAMMVKPPDFDPSQRYPILSHTYSGPHAPRVRNAWGGTTYMWHQMLAQKGYIIWILDNRTASGKGIKSSWPGYRNLGELELRDLEDGLSWLRTQPFVDGERIGLWGWSYGGYMTAYALTHSQSFKVGISGAPVTDWRLYDSIYTERYMGMPQNNPTGYQRSSAVEAAENLHGKLLLIHGTMDDNVHLQNTLKLAYALQEAGQQFQLMLYPKNRHSIRQPQQLLHLRTLMTEFILDNL